VQTRVDIFFFVPPWTKELEPLDLGIKEYSLY
jgi:hypothetical protein